MTSIFIDQKTLMSNYVCFLKGLKNIALIYK